ncbi:MAG: C-terminal binding protein [Actinomycetota bacterium]
MEEKVKYKVVRLNCKLFPVISDEIQILQSAGADFIQVQGDDIPEHLLDADVVMVVSAKIKGEVIKKLTKCGLIARIGTGTDKIDVAEATANGILVTNVPDFCTSELADHTIALLLSAARKIVQLDKNTRISNLNIRNEVSMRRIAGKKLGLIGFGTLARSVSNRAKAFALDVFAYDPYVEAYDMEKFGVTKLNSIEDVLKECDFVSLHLPLNDKTFHLIGEEQLRMMKPTAILINTARGAVIDEAALAKALSEHWIEAAAVDVFENINPFEEVPTKQLSPLFLLENTVLTPHVAATSVESLIEVQTKAATEVARVLSGRWPENCINQEVKARYNLSK